AVKWIAKFTLGIVDGVEIEDDVSNARGERPAGVVGDFHQRRSPLSQVNGSRQIGWKVSQRRKAPAAVGRRTDDGRREDASIFTVVARKDLDLFDILGSSQRVLNPLGRSACRRKIIE